MYKLIILQYYVLASCNVECFYALSFLTLAIGGTTIAGSNIKANSWTKEVFGFGSMIHDVLHSIYYCNLLLQGRASNSGFLEVHDFRWTRKRKTRLH
jgi:hypothetical protein